MTANWSVRRQLLLRLSAAPCALLLAMSLLGEARTFPPQAPKRGLDVAAAHFPVLGGALGGGGLGVSTRSTFDEPPVRVVAHRAGASPAPASSRQLPRARSHYTGYTAWEPTLGVTKDGDIFFTAMRLACCDGIDVIRSRDRGRTWEAVSPKLPTGQKAHIASGDPYLYVDPHTDRVFTVDLQPASCSELSHSDDQGETWTTKVACGGPRDDHQTLFSGPPTKSQTADYPNVVYYCANQIGLGVTLCSKSLDGGDTFVPTGEPAYGQRVDVTYVRCFGTTGHGVVGGDGTVYLPRVECGQPWLAISRDEGATWERVQVADKGGLGHEAGVAVDGKGNIYFTWTSDADELPYLAVSRDDGKTWSKPLMIAPPGVKIGVLPGVAVGKPGQIAIVYIGTDDAKTPLGPTDTGYKATWNGYLTLSNNALSAQPRFVTTAIGNSIDPLSRGRCLHRCDDLGDFFDVVIAPDGTTWLALVDACLKTCATAEGSENDSSGEGIVVELRRAARR